VDQGVGCTGRQDKAVGASGSKRSSEGGTTRDGRPRQHARVVYRGGLERTVGLCVCDVCVCLCDTAAESQPKDHESNDEGQQ